MEDWIKAGNKCYVNSAMGWMNSGCMTIKRVGRKYFYLKGEPRVRIDIHTLCGSCLGYGTICRVYPSKEAFDSVQELLRKRKVLVQSVHLLTDEEVIEIYNKIIQRDRKQ